MCSCTATAARCCLPRLLGIPIGERALLGPLFRCTSRTHRIFVHRILAPRAMEINCWTLVAIEPSGALYSFLLLAKRSSVQIKRIRAFGRFAKRNDPLVCAVATCKNKSSAFQEMPMSVRSHRSFSSPLLRPKLEWLNRSARQSRMHELISGLTRSNAIETAVTDFWNGLREVRFAVP